MLRCMEPLQQVKVFLFDVLFFKERSERSPGHSVEGQLNENVGERIDTL